MSTTRIAVVLDVDHCPDMDLPMRTAEYLQRILGGVQGVTYVSVVQGDMDNVAWTPLETQGAGRRRFVA